MAEIPSSSTNSDVLLTTSQLKTLNDFYILNEIGEGSYSTVYLASTKDKHNRCALKVCSKLRIQREKKVFFFLLNWEFLSKLSLDQTSFSRKRQPEIAFHKGKSEAIYR